MKNNGINALGWVALITMIIGGMTSGIGVGIFFSVLGFILTTILYYKIDKLGYGTTLFNFTIYQYLIALVPTGLLVYLGVNNYSDKSHGVLFLVCVLVFALLLFLAILNYFIAKSLNAIGAATHNTWFKISGVLTKIGAYTLPVLVGFFFVILAQPFFLLGCATYNPIARVNNEQNS